MHIIENEKPKPPHSNKQAKKKKCTRKTEREQKNSKKDEGT